jgi:hypothetical protein
MKNEERRTKKAIRDLDILTRYVVSRFVRRVVFRMRACVRGQTASMAMAKVPGEAQGWSVKREAKKGETGSNRIDERRVNESVSHRSVDGRGRECIHIRA